MKNNRSMPLLADLFLTFARVGVMMFGGGYAMLPILQREIVEKKGWATEDQLADYYAVGQCTPGIIAVNTATFVGSESAGIAGGVIATLGVVFGPIIIITVIAADFIFFTVKGYDAVKDEVSIRADVKRHIVFFKRENGFYQINPVNRAFEQRAHTVARDGQGDCSAFIELILNGGQHIAEVNIINHQAFLHS